MAVDLPSQMRQKGNRGMMKKVFLIILSVLVLIAPSIAIVGCYFYYKSAAPQVVSSDLVSVTVKDEKGNQLGDAKDAQFLSIFAGMFGSEEGNQPEALIALPQEALNYAKYTASFLDNFNIESDYTYYFSSDPQKCYYVGQGNRVYRIAAQAAEVFLNSDYSEAVYSTAIPPVLTVGDRTVVPYTLNWSYKTVGGVLKDASCSYADRNEITVLDGFLASFSPECNYAPDEINLKVMDTDKNVSLYEGPYKGLANLMIEGAKNVSVDMTLVWKNSEQSSYAGSAKYFFKGKLFGNPSFSISTNEATCGQVVMLEVQNVISKDEISVQIEPSLDFVPTFYPVEGGFRALIPLALNTVMADSTTYSITMSSSGETEIFLLKVNPLVTESFKWYTSDDAANYYTDAAKEDLANNLKDIAATPSDFTFEGGKFRVPTQNNLDVSTVTYSFGTRVAIQSIKSAPEFTALSTMYGALSGTNYSEGTKTKVLAAFDGKVVYVGAQTAVGRMVVIDHGSGLKSWYMNLSSDIQVQVGDTVKGGQVISSAADGGLNSWMNCNFHVAVTVDGVPVNLQSLIDGGLIVKAE